MEEERAASQPSKTTTLPLPAGESAAAAAAPTPPVAGSPAPVSDDVFYGGVVGTHTTPSQDEEREQEGEQEEDFTDEDFSSDEDDDDSDDEDVDSDSEFEEDDQPAPEVKNGGGVAAVAGAFLGQPARIATVQSTVCFVQLAMSSAPLFCHCQYQPGGGEIIVYYRYTRFLRSQSGGDGVDMHILGPKQARLRFVIAAPLAADPASSLRFAGAAVASLVYPARFSTQLQALWSAATLRVRVLPARAMRLVVTVDAGILRPGDCTPERMVCMRAALETVARERAGAPPPFDVEELIQLPAVLKSEDDVRPTKRRRVTGEDCPICHEVLEEGLAAWPRCSHIFHGRCLEQHLLRGHQECPICRSELKLSTATCRT